MTPNAQAKIEKWTYQPKNIYTSNDTKIERKDDGQNGTKYLQITYRRKS